MKILNRMTFRVQGIWAYNRGSEITWDGEARPFLSDLCWISHSKRSINVFGGQGFGGRIEILLLAKAKKFGVKFPKYALKLIKI